MADLKSTKTHNNLKHAFAGESQANRRYLYFADKADIEGYPEIAGNFRDTAEGETGHAHGHLEYLKIVGDPATGKPIGNTRLNLAAAIAGETYEYTEMYPGFARVAREEGFEEVAEWFETLARAASPGWNRTYCTAEIRSSSERPASNVAGTRAPSISSARCASIPSSR